MLVSKKRKTPNSPQTRCLRRVSLNYVVITLCFSIGLPIHTLNVLQNNFGVFQGIYRQSKGILAVNLNCFSLNKGAVVTVKGYGNAVAFFNQKHIHTIVNGNIIIFVIKL